MNLFNLVRTDDGKQTMVPASPARSVGKSWTRSKSSLSPDLCDTSDLSTDTDDISRDEQLSVSTKYCAVPGSAGSRLNRHNVMFRLHGDVIALSILGHMNIHSIILRMHSLKCSLVPFFR